MKAGDMVTRRSGQRFKVGIVLYMSSCETEAFVYYTKSSSKVAARNWFNTPELEIVSESR